MCILMDYDFQSCHYYAKPNVFTLFSFSSEIEIWTRLFYDIQEVDDILIPKAQKKTYDCISDFDGSQNWICQNKTSENAILNVFIAVRYVVTKFRLLTRYDQ